MKVSLQDWLKNNWLTEYKTNAKEILQERVFEWMKIEHPDLIESL